MASSQVYIIVRSTIKAEHRDLFLQTAKRSIPVIRQIEGCLQMFVYEDMETPSRFLIIGTWASEDLWRQHLQSDAAKEFIQLGDSITEDFSIQKLYGKSA